MIHKNMVSLLFLLFFNHFILGVEHSSPLTTTAFVISGLGLVGYDMYVKHEERQKRQKIWTDFNKNIRQKMKERNEKLEKESNIIEANRRAIVTKLKSTKKRSARLLPLAVLEGDGQLLKIALETDPDALYVSKDGTTVIDDIVESRKLTKDQKKQWLTMVRHTWSRNDLDVQLKRRLLENKLIKQDLLSHGADPNQKDENGNPLLCIAARYGRPENVHLLLRYGADVKSEDSFGNTALYLVSKKLPRKRIPYTLITCLEYLLEYEAPLFQKNKSKRLRSAADTLYRFKPVSPSDNAERKKIWDAISSSIMKREKECPICYTPYQRKSQVYIFGCFHDACVSCARRLDKCPECRYPKKQEPRIVNEVANQQHLRFLQSLIEEQSPVPSRAVGINPPGFSIRTTQPDVEIDPLMSLGFFSTV